MKHPSLITLSLFFFTVSGFIAQAQVYRVPINTRSTPANAEVGMSLHRRFQHYNEKTGNPADIYDRNIHSPKSVNILDDKKKFYVHSLEGRLTTVYSLDSFKLVKIIQHAFDKTNQHLFKETKYFDYEFRTKNTEPNLFEGKPVESCFSHDGKYLWVTYYRRTYDPNAAEPSALCIIDTETDEIVRVMPTAPLPKMIACSPDNKYIAVTHWGDNTVGLIDISSNNPQTFKHVKNMVVDYRLPMNLNSQKPVDRDAECGHCLRGTVFTPDAKHVLVAKMGGTGIAVIDALNGKYLGSVTGMKDNLRHIIINGDYLYLSINKHGYIQRTAWKNLVDHFTENGFAKPYTSWENVYVGTGARTIVSRKDGKYVFAAVNNESKIVAVRTSDMKVVAECKADSYPVGMDLSEDGKWLMVTSQGKSSGGGNSVMVYEVNYN